MAVGAPPEPLSEVRLGWTEPMRMAGLHADPSGVQDAGTVLQATLLPGMSTQTPSVRYISLFVAARYYRAEAGDGVQVRLPWREYLRRLEALIAVSSVRHHRATGDAPVGIIGSTAGELMSSKTHFELKTNLRNPPYNIYRGSLANLALVDLSRQTDPLFDAAKPLAKAWDIGAAGPFGSDLQKGVLSPEADRGVVDDAAHAFCICRVPDGSAEQRELTHLLLGLGRKFDLPTYGIAEDGDLIAYRAVSWRLLLELVDRSPGRALVQQHLLARLLEPDLLDAPLQQALRSALYLWRWVAARAFFERGWTMVFDRAVKMVKSTREGLDRADLRQAMAASYRDDHPDEPLEVISALAAEKWTDPSWLASRFAGPHSRDFLLLLCAGMAAARADLANGPGQLQVLRRERAIPFDREWRRLESQCAAGTSASQFFAEIAEATLAGHVRSTLRKMHFGNPDSALLDYEAGRWVVPGKALSLPRPIPAGGGTRLDIALNWADQLGLITRDAGSTNLTQLARSACARWDTEHGE